MNDRKDAVLRGRPAGPGLQRADEDSFTYHYARYEGGQHWFSAERDGDEVGHAHVIEQWGPGGPHAEIRRLWTNPQYRGRGIGSRLLDNVAEHFEGHEVRLKPYPAGEDSDPDEDDLRVYYGSRGFGDYQLKDGDPFELYDYMTRPRSRGPQEKARHRAPGGRRSPAASPLYLHGGPNRVGPGGFIHQDAMPLSHGRARHNFFTASREVGEEAADMRDGLGHGWIHIVEPAGDFEVDGGEPESWKSEAPLRVVGVEPGRLNGETPHPPILRQQTGSAGSSAARGHLYHATPYPGGFPHDERTHAGTRAAAENRIAKTNPADYGLPVGTSATSIGALPPDRHTHPVPVDAGWCDRWPESYRPFPPSASARNDPLLRLRGFFPLPSGTGLPHTGCYPVSQADLADWSGLSSSGSETAGSAAYRRDWIAGHAAAAVTRWRARADFPGPVQTQRRSSAMPDPDDHRTTRPEAGSPESHPVLKDMAEAAGVISDAGAYLSLTREFAEPSLEEGDWPRDLDSSETLRMVGHLADIAYGAGSCLAGITCQHAIPDTAKPELDVIANLLFEAGRKLSALTGTLGREASAASPAQQAGQDFPAAPTASPPADPARQAPPRTTPAAGRPRHRR